MLRKGATQLDTGNELKILMAGCSGGHVPIVIRALDLMGQHGSPVQMLSIYSDAFFEAARHNSTDVMKLLLNCGTRFERQCLSKAFDVACESGHSKAVRCLIEHDTDNLFGVQQCNKGFEKAAMHGHCELVCYFMEHCSGRSYFTISEEAIMTAAGNGYADIVRFLIEEVKRSELRHSTLNRALNTASRHGRREVVELLIREGGNLNAVVEEVSAPGLDGHSNALQGALRSFHPRLIRADRRRADAITHEATIHLLLNNGADVNELAGCPTYPLYAAAAQCSDRVVQSIIDKGAVLNESSSEYGTALQAAAGRGLGAATITKLLLQAGAIIPESDAGKNPVLNAALGFGLRIEDALVDGSGAVVKLLLPRLPMEKAESEGYGILLQKAVVVGDRDFVELLLQREVDVDAVGHNYGVRFRLLPLWAM